MILATSAESQISVLRLANTRPWQLYLREERVRWMACGCFRARSSTASSSPGIRAHRLVTFVIWFSQRLSSFNSDFIPNTSAIRVFLVTASFRGNQHTRTGLSASTQYQALRGENLYLSPDGEHGDVVFLAEGFGGIGEIKSRLVAEVAHAIKTEELAGRLSSLHHAV